MVGCVDSPMEMKVGRTGSSDGCHSSPMGRDSNDDAVGGTVLVQ